MMGPWGKHHPAASFDSRIHDNSQQNFTVIRLQLSVAKQEGYC